MHNVQLTYSIINFDFFELNVNGFCESGIVKENIGYTPTDNDWFKVNFFIKYSSLFSLNLIVVSLSITTGVLLIKRVVTYSPGSPEVYKYNGDDDLKAKFISLLCEKKSD